MAKQSFVSAQVLTAAQMTALQSNDFNQTVSTKTASYTLVASDAGTKLVMNSASSTTITVNTSLFTAGDTLTILNIGAGVCTITAGTATVSSATSLLLVQFGGGTLYFTSAGVSVFQADSSVSATNSDSNRNAVINGNMDIWQRGTTFTNPGGGSGTYTADRWTVYFNGNGTVTQETSVKPDTSLFSMKITSTATSSDNAIFQLVEQKNMARFRGKTVALSVKLAGTATTTPSVTLNYSTTADDTLTNTSTAITASLTTIPAINASTFVTWVLVFAVPTTAKTLRIGIGTQAVVNTNVLYVSEVQLEAGSVATPFEFEDISTTLAKCQRYYYRTTADTTYAFLGFGMGVSSTLAKALITPPVTMRTVPTVLDTPTVSTLRLTDGVSGTTATVVAYDGDTTNELMTLNVTVASGLTQFRPYLFGANNSAVAYVGFGAEL